MESLFAWSSNLSDSTKFALKITGGLGFVCGTVYICQKVHASLKEKKLR